MQGALKESASRFGPVISSSSPPRISKARAVHVQQSKSTVATEHPESGYPSSTLPFFFKQPNTKATPATSTVTSNALQLDKGPPRTSKRLENSSSILKGTTSIKPSRQVRHVATSTSKRLEATTVEMTPESVNPVSQITAMATVEAEEPVAVDAEPSLDLPAYSYLSYTPEPSRKYIRVTSEVDRVLDNVVGPVGFDMEWKVIHRRGVAQRPVAVIQIADRRRIFIIQTSAMKGLFPKKLKQLLEDPTIVKTGVNIKGDAKKLFKDHGVKIQNLVELSWLSRQADSKLRCGGKSTARSLIALRKLAAEYLGKDLVKNEVRTGDWERLLDDEQLKYAANDAHCSIILYNYFIELAKTDKKSLQAHLYTLNVNLSGEVIAALEESGRDDELEAFEAESSTHPSQPSLPPPPPTTRARKAVTSTAPKRPSKPTSFRRPAEIIELSDSDSDLELKLLAPPIKSSNMINGLTKVRTPARDAQRPSEAELEQLAADFQAFRLHDVSTVAHTPARRAPRAPRLTEIELSNLAADFQSVKLSEGAAMERVSARRSPAVAEAASVTAAKALDPFGAPACADSASRVSRTMAYATGMKK